MYNTLLRLETILESIDKIKEYSDGFEEADEFYHDSRSFDATMMQFVVLGETILRLDKKFKEENYQIPWQKIKDFRNIIAHDYFGIDPEEIWDIIHQKLLPLRQEILKIVKHCS